MTMRSLLVPLIGAAPSAVPLEAAFQLARRFDAFVEAYHPVLDPVLSAAYFGDGATGPILDNVVAAIGRESELRRQRAQALYERTLAAADGAAPRTDFASESGIEEDLVATRARRHDLCLMPRLDKTTAYLGVIESVLYESGRPMLAVPPDGAVPAEAGIAVIAWNDTPEAARAVALALPLIERMARVVVVGVGEVPLDGMAEYLRRHDLAVTARMLEKQSRSMLEDPAGEMILRACAEENADLLVMGAYSHGRLRRLVMGGATRKALSEATIPVLMAH